MKVVIESDAAKRIKKFDPSTKERLKKALVFLSNNPQAGKHLEDRLKGLQSYRVGRYRIIYRIEKDRFVLCVVWVGHRAEVYEEIMKALGR